MEPAPVVKRLVPLLALGAVALTAHTAFNLRKLRRPEPSVTAIDEAVSVVIPARNEQDSLTDALRSVQTQENVAHMSIHVLDDGSSDDTAAIADAAAAADQRVRVTHAPDADPPPGWLGKNYACSRLAGIASDARVLVFMDADVVLESNAINALVHELRRTNSTLIAPYPRQLAETWVERLVQPLLAWSWMTTVPLGVAESRQWASMSVANGQLLAFDAEGYRRMGGHEAVRSDVIEDVALMRRVREVGERALTVDGSSLATCRMYRTPVDLIDGYTKSAWNAFGGPVGSIAANSLLIGLYVVPAAAVLLSKGHTRAWGLVGYAAAVTGRILVARNTGERVLPDALAQPLSIMAFASINALSWWRHLRGQNHWKGRRLTA
jgi:glycosyltransferase involved in cell wall biosynthesis